MKTPKQYNEELKALRESGDDATIKFLHEMIEDSLNEARNLFTNRHTRAAINKLIREKLYSEEEGEQ